MRGCFDALSIAQKKEKSKGFRLYFLKIIVAFSPLCFFVLIFAEAKARSRRRLRASAHTLHRPMARKMPIIPSAAMSETILPSLLNL